MATIDTTSAGSTPEKATRIVFVGSTKDALLEVVVDQMAPAVERFPAGGLSQLTRDGIPNTANVLYLESLKLVAE
jgi:hypothetical protein